MKPSVILIFLICILPIVSADLFPTATSTVNIGDNPERLGVNIFLPDEIFNSSAATSNSTNFWITNLGPLDFVNSTEFNNIASTLTLDKTWLESFGNELWCELTGCIMTGNIGMGDSSITDVSNITINDNIFFGDLDHFLRRGALGFDGLSNNAFAFQQNIEHPEGTVPFIVTANKTNSDNDAVLIMAQIGLNESNSILGNSWIIVVNNLTNNLTEYSKCFLVAGLLDKTLRVQCDSGETGADLIVQDDIQSFGTMFADGGIRAETLVDFIMNGEDVNIQGGGLHILTPVTFERGVVEGNEVTTFMEDFGGGLGSFTNLQDDLGNWFVTANILCDDGDCANAIGISGVGNIIIEANISTVNINETSLNFIYSLTNMLGANDFEVTVNNNVGSGEVSIFTDSTNNVIKSSQSITLPASMSNQPKVSIRFNCDVTNTNRQCFVDTISVNGTAIATTLTNVSGFDSVIKFGDGTLAADGFPERGIFYNASGDTIVIRGNATFDNIIEQDLNITNSISLNGTTIFDWAGVVSSPLFPEYFLTNGSSVMQGNTNQNGFNIYNVGDINFSNGYKITDRSNAVMVLQGNSDGGFNGGAYEFYSNAPDSATVSHNIFLRIFSRGLPTDVSNQEGVDLRYDNVSEEVIMMSMEPTGTGRVLPLRLTTFGNDGILIQADGDVLISNAEMIGDVQMQDGDGIVWGTNSGEILAGTDIDKMTLKAGGLSLIGLDTDNAKITIGDISVNWDASTIVMDFITEITTINHALIVEGDLTAANFSTNGSLKLTGPIEGKTITIKMIDNQFHNSGTLSLSTRGTDSGAVFTSGNTITFDQAVATTSFVTHQGLTITGDSGITVSLINAEGKDGFDGTGTDAGDGSTNILKGGDGGEAFSPHFGGDGGDIIITPGLLGVGVAGDGVDGILNVTGNSVFTGVIFADRLVLGQLNESVNSSLNISSGDIVADVIYANAFMGRSPPPICDMSDLSCAVFFPKYRKTLYVDINKDWTINKINYEEEDYTTGEFNSGPCNNGADGNARKICDNLISKFQSLQSDYQKDLLLRQQKEACNYRWSGKECFEIVRTNTDYAGAVEIIQVNKTIIVEKNITRLNLITLMVEVVSESIEVKTNELINKGFWRDGCDWDGDYYCEVRELR